MCCNHNWINKNKSLRKMAANRAAIFCPYVSEIQVQLDMSSNHVVHGGSVVSQQFVSGEILRV